MNKYLEKIASFDEMTGKKDVEIGRIKEVPKIKSPGINLIKGSKTLLQRALLKRASVETGTTPKQDLLNTGVIGAIGGVGTLATSKIMKASPRTFGTARRFHNAKVLALGTGIGLVGDYAGIKLNHMLNKNVK